MIEVVNLGLNNLGSITSALVASTRAPIRTIAFPGESESPELVILPGTGSYGAAMRLLEERGFRDLFAAYNEQSSVFIAGICLGMQLLGQTSEESPGVSGIGLIEGSVRRLPEFDGADGRVPHVGWAGLEGLEIAQSFYFENRNVRDVYFSHSYHLVLDTPGVDVLTVNRGDTRFTGAFRTGTITGYQFHPEKSSSFGLEIISEMLRWAGIEN